MYKWNAEIEKLGKFPDDRTISMNSLRRFYLSAMLIVNRKTTRINYRKIIVSFSVLSRFLKRNAVYYNFISLC